MPKPFYNEQTVVVDGETLRLAINFRAIDSTEQLIGLAYDDILDEIQREGAFTGMSTKVLWGLLRQHHPEITLDETASLCYGDAGVVVGLAMRELLAAAFPEPGEHEQAKDANPPERGGQLQTTESNG